MPFAKILLPRAVPEPFDYRIPQGMALGEGSVVRVPFGRGGENGVVWGLAETSRVPAAKMKEVLRVHPVPPFTPAFRAFLDWTAQYCFSSPGAVLAMALPVDEALEPPKPERLVRLTGRMPEKRTEARSRALAVLAEAGALHKTELADRAGVGAAVVSGLVKQGVLEEFEAAAPPPSYPAYRPEAAQPPELSPEQGLAAKELCAQVKARAYATTLLDGVTGSGKTEVYLEAVAEALTEGRQVLVLLPEIVLTQQLMMRFAARLGFAPTPWHSALTPRERREHCRAIGDGRAKLVVGARSALFLPYRDLALIVVDEEHETAYKQEEGVVYHARDMAVARGYHEGFPVVLVSATPSLETLNNVEAGKFGRLHLPERHGEAEMQEMELVDMREERLDSQHWLSAPLKEALAGTLAQGEQALLYLNRRGYAPLTLCRKCGYRFQCPSCTAWLVTHRRPEGLVCHHCGYRTGLPKACPGCQAEESFAACGPGVERLAEEVAETFPNARVVQMTSDTMEHPEEARRTVKAILGQGADIIIGTQMVAKGHHFPHLTLVGVVDADLGLEGGDLRAGEKSYQLLHQVAGRAGRAHLKGRALIQTYRPDHPLMQALKTHDRDRFMAREREQRKAAGLPPFGKLAAIILSGRDEAQVRAFAAELARHAPQAEGVRVLGPAPAPLARLKGQHRYRLLVKGPKSLPMQRYLAAWLDGANVPSALRLKVDVDPYSFL